jgi:hypothetical protein
VPEQCGRRIEKINVDVYLQSLSKDRLSATLVSKETKKQRNKELKN